jgi:DNA (cytosine-5)-methyltransferase 1
MYETLRIVAKLKPKYVIWENVKNLLSKKHRHNFDKYLDRMAELGYQNFYQVLNAKDYGIPQNRERVFTISILGGGEFIFPEKQELKLRLKDMLEENVDEKYYLSQQMVHYISASNEKWTGNNKGHDCVKRVYSDNGISPTLTDMQGGNRQPKVLIKNATKQGYDIATEGDSINLQNPNSATRRARVGHGISNTLQTSDSMAVAVAQRGRENGQQLEISDREYANAITSVQKDSMAQEKLRISKWWRYWWKNRLVLNWCLWQRLWKQRQTTR